MELALRPYVTAGVALAGAGLIAVTPVAPPPPLDLQERAVQLTTAVDTVLGDLVGGLEQAVGTLTGAGGASALPGLGALLDPGIAQSLDTGIQTTLIDSIMSLETMLNTGLGSLGTALSTPLENLATMLSNLATTLTDMGGAFVFLGGIVSNFETIVSDLADFIILGTEFTLPAINQSLFDIPVQLVLFASNLVDLVTGAPLAGDPAAAVSDVGAVAAASALSGTESAIQALLVNFLGSGGLVDSIGVAFIETFLAGLIDAPFTFVSSVLSDVGTFIGEISPVLEPIDTLVGTDLSALVGDVGGLATLVGIVLPYTTLVEPLIFGNFEELVGLGSFLIGGASAVGEPGDLAALPTDLLTVF